MIAPPCFSRSKRRWTQAERPPPSLEPKPCRTSLIPTTGSPRGFTSRTNFLRSDLMHSAKLLGFLLAGLVSLPVLADDDAKPAEGGKPAAAIADQKSSTQGAVTVGGKSIAYTADAGLLVLKNAKGEPTAEMSYVAYLANGTSATSRPIMFIYNGGPGSSTIWL